MAAFAAYESNQISKRTRESNFSALVTSGKFNSTHQVLGLDQQIISGEPKVGFYVANKDELEVVEWIMRTFVKYASHQKTIEECNKRGVINKNGKPFKKGSLITLLTNKKYIGKWEANPENKEKRQDRLLPYDLYKEIDLPHGCVVDIDLWKRVQQTVKEIAGAKLKNTRLTRVYPLSGILKFEDGSTFQGKSAWGKFSEERRHYYQNGHAGRINVDLIENEAKKTVGEIIRSSPKVQEAILRRCKDSQSLSSLLDSQAKLLRNEIKVLEVEKETCNKRLDFLLADGDMEEAKLFKEEFKNRVSGINKKIEECQKNLELVEVKSKSVKEDEFDWKELGGKAVKIQDLIQENDPVALKTAYRSLFEAIVVGKADNQGKRPLRFVLRDETSDGDSWKKIGPQFPVTLAPTQRCVGEELAQVANAILNR